MTPQSPHGELAAAVLDACRERGLMLATAESCTGGLVAGTLTDIAGSSDVVERGFVTYSNRAKSEMLGVPASMIERHGAVSEAVARAMATGAQTQAGVDLAIAITGVAGPGGGTAEKPVGLVHFACADLSGQVTHAERRFGDISRADIRSLSVRVALKLLLEAAGA